MSSRSWKRWTLGAALAAAAAHGPEAQGVPGRTPRATRPQRPPAVLHVPADLGTIQAAIDRARDGDVVVVAPGTYSERIDFHGKALEVLGTEGAARTILSSPDGGPVVLFRSGEGPESRLMGFTIRGGNGDFEGDGGVVSCEPYGGPVASPYLSDCVIEGGSTDFLWQGTGAAGLDGNAILERCVLRQNWAFQFAGGAAEGVLTMLQCVVEDNWSCEGGGGLRLLAGSRVEDTVIQRNGAGPCGYHGVYHDSSGGGILALGAVELVGCVLRDNWVEGPRELVGACVGESRGGGLAAGGAATLRRCTIVANGLQSCSSAAGLEGGPTLIDCIVQGNEDPHGTYAARTSFRYSDVQGGAAGSGSFDADPLFVDAGAGDFRLQVGSPCIDAGDLSSPPDPDGTRADLGALHRPAGTPPLAVARLETARLVAADPARSESFGTALAVEGETALIGATRAMYDGLHDAAFVFRRSGAGWTEEARLAPALPQPGDGFGAALALAGNVAVVGAPLRDTVGTDDGAVYVFERASVGAPFVETLELRPRAQRAGERFGGALALEAGLLVVGAVGAPFSGFGEEVHVFVFQRRGPGHWDEVALLAPPRYRWPDFPTHFPVAVALSGTTIVVGVPGFEHQFEYPGRAFVYERAGATPHSWVQTSELAPLDTGDGYAAFGWSVSIAGDSLLVGSDLGAQAYERRGPGLPWGRATRLEPWEPTQVLVRGDRAWLAGSSGVRELLQTSPGAPWVEVARPGVAGGPLAADAGTLLVGAPGEDRGVGACRVLARGPELDAIGRDQAADAEPVTLRGRELGTVTEVRLDGVAQPIVGQSATELVLAPPARIPGFADLELVTPQGTLALAGRYPSLPTLEARASGIGGPLTLRVDSGATGAFLLLASLELRATPLPLLTPPTHYGLLLDLQPGRWGRTGPQVLDASGVTELTFPVPNVRGLIGTSVHFQAWCQRGLFGPLRHSFTNAASVTF